MAVEMRRVLAIQAWHVETQDAFAADGAGHPGRRPVTLPTLARHAGFEAREDDAAASAVSLHVEATDGLGGLRPLALVSEGEEAFAWWVMVGTGVLCAEVQGEAVELEDLASLEWEFPD